jgi:NAD(P)-dependent dehydrogenase (short-subunit alcohol dehydrogenase family)
VVDNRLFHRLRAGTCARGLARGWNAAVTARDPATVSDIVTGYDSTAVALPLDVTNPAQIESAVHETQTRFGAIDVLVSHAGYGYRGAVEEVDEAAWQAAWRSG